MPPSRSGAFGTRPLGPRGTLVCFHAHPDDEVITTGGTIARAVAEGHRVVLVFATRGELGLVPADLDGEALGDRRTREASRAAEILGVHHVEYLGYQDSGMAGDDTNDDPGTFWTADVEEAAGRLAAVLEREAADVVTIYDDHGGYHHPDHIQVHRVGVRAVELAGTPRVYEATADADHFAEQIRAMRDSIPPEMAEEIPRPEDFEDNFSPAELITTRVDIRPYLATKRAALAAHSSQVDETSFFLQMPEELFAVAFGTEWFIRRDAQPGTTETWLFPESPVMSWLLLAVGLLTLGLGVNVLRPSRSLLGMVISFLAEWLASELAHWTILVLGALVALLATFGGLESTAGWIGLVAACIGFVLLAVELWLGWRSGPTVVRELHGAGLGAPDPFGGRTLRLLFPFYFGDRRVRRIADVRYAEGAGQRHLADVYVPRNGVENAAVLLQIHGGAWLVGNKRQQGRPLMNRMAAAGWVCVAINYQLAPRHKMPDAIVDVKRALAWIHEHIAEYGGDPDRIIVSGGSAGGHLAAMAALTVNDPEYQPGFESADTSVLACVPLYPPTDLLALFDYGGQWTRRMTERTTRWVFGASPTEDPDRYRHWSPVTLVRPGIVPFLVVQGTGDDLVPYRLTRAFVEQLRAQPGQQVVYVELPGAPHAFEVFHSLRAEAAASAVRRFCSWVTANEMARELTAGRATSSGRAMAADDDRIDAEAR